MCLVPKNNFDEMKTVIKRLKKYIGFMAPCDWEASEWFENLTFDECETTFYVLGATDQEDAKLKVFEKEYLKFCEEDIKRNAFLGLLYLSCDMNEIDFDKILKQLGEREYPILNEIVEAWSDKYDSEWQFVHEPKIHQLSEETIKWFVYDLVDIDIIVQTVQKI